MAIIFHKGHNEILDSLDCFYSVTGKCYINTRELYECLSKYNLSLNEIRETIETSVGICLFQVSPDVYKFKPRVMRNGINYSMRNDVSNEIRKLISNIQLLGRDNASLLDEKDKVYLQNVITIM